MKDKIEKRILIIQKHRKQKNKIANKRMRIKIEIQNKFYPYLIGEIKKKINLKKKRRKKQSKEWGSKLK